MATINYSDIIGDDGAFEDLESKIDDLEKFVKAKGKSLQNSLNIASPEESEQVRKLALEVEKLKKAQIELEKLRKTQNNTRKKASELSQKELIALEEERQQLNKNRKEARAIAKLKQAQVGSIEQLRAKLSVVTIEWAKLTEAERENSKRGQRLVNVKKDLTEELKKLERQTGDNRRNVGNYTEAFKEAIRELRKEKKEIVENVAVLRKQQSELKKGTAEWLQYEKAIQGAESRLDKVNDELGEGSPNVATGGGLLDRIKAQGGETLESAGGGVTGTLGRIAGGLNPVTIAVGAVVAGVGVLGKAVLDVEEKFTQLRGEIRKLTGATGDQLDQLTVNTEALVNVFGDGSNEVIRSQNVLMKEFGLTAEQSFSILEQGYLSGANAQGDLLDSITEYSTQIRSAGGSAQDLIAILNKSGQQGIYSDKGIDTVKEFGLRIREQTDATRKSLNDAFGSKFTNNILKGISNGSITTLDALAEVSEKLGDTTIPANKLQAVIADVFGGAGEDAGIEFIRSLKDINEETDNLVDAMNPLVIQQKRQLDLQKDLAREQNELAKTFEGASGSIENFGTQLKTGFFSVLNSVTRGIKNTATNIGNVFTGLTSNNDELASGSLKRLANSFLENIGLTSSFTDEIFKLTDAEEKAIRVEGLKNEILDRAGDLVARETQEMNNLITAINDNNITNEERAKLIDRINEKYPTVLKNLIGEDGKIKDVTLARQRLAKAIVETAFARAKEVLLQEKINAIADRTLKKIDAERRAREESVLSQVLKSPFTETATEEAKRLNEELETTTDNISDLASGALDKELKQTLLEVTKLFEGQSAQIFGDNLDEQGATISNLKTQVEQLNVELNNTEDADLQAKLKSRLSSIKAQLQSTEGAFDQTSTAYRELLGLIESGESRANGGGQGAGGVGSGVTGGRRAKELDLIEQIRKKRADLEDESFDKAVELLNIRIDKEIKGFEKLRKETKGQLVDGLISIEEFEKRMGQINTISKLAEQERQKEIDRLRVEYIDKETEDRLKAKRDEIKQILIEEEVSLKKRGEVNSAIERQLSDRRIELYRGELSVLTNADKERREEILSLENRQANSGLTEEELKRLQALKDAKDLKADILDVELKLLSAVNSSAQAEVKRIADLEKSQVQGQIDEASREIDLQREVISKKGAEATEQELTQLKSLINKRYELRKRAVEDEYDLQLSQLEKGSLEFQKVEQDKNNALKNLAFENAKEMRAINKTIVDAGKKDWQDFLNDVTKVFTQILEKLEETYNKQLEKAEENLDKQGSKVEEQQERARQGLGNTLKFERQEQAKREAEVVQAQKRLERVQKTKALYASYSSNSSNPGVANPLNKTLRDFAILEAISRGFKDGGYTGDYGVNQVAGVTHGQEFVVDAPMTKALGLRGATMGDFKEKFIKGDFWSAKTDRGGLETNSFRTQRREFTKQVPQVTFDSNSIVKEIRELKDFEMSKPDRSLDVKQVADGILDFVETIRVRGKVEKNRYRIKKDRF